MIRLSTSSNIVFHRPDGSMFPLEKTFRYAGEAGFHYLDINFYDWIYPHSPFLSENWEAWIERIAEVKNNIGMEVFQCHAAPNQFLNHKFTPEQQKNQLELVKRSVYCSHVLGAKVCVMHPDTDTLDFTKSKAGNLAYFDKMLAYTQQFGIDIALENMCLLGAQKRKYLIWPDEFLDLLEAYGDSHLGVCWDFEHGIIMGMDQVQVIRQLGKHLKATHISDTASRTDPDFMHIMPLFGNFDWTPVLKVLDEIGYDGCFSYEVHNYANRLPDEVLPTALKLACEIGKFLLTPYRRDS